MQKTDPKLDRKSSVEKWSEMYKFLVPNGTHFSCQYHFFDNEETQKIKKILPNGVDLQEKTIQNYGRNITLPRLCALCSTCRPSTKEIAKAQYESQSFSPIIWQLKERIENRLDKIGVFQDCFVINFRSGSDSIGDHKFVSDNDVAYLWIGQPRNFYIVSETNGKNNKKIMVKSGTLILIEKEFVNQWSIKVPKTKAKSSQGEAFLLVFK